MVDNFCNEMNCFQAEQKNSYDNLNYVPLVKLMKKLLPHGIPELPKIHNQLMKNFTDDGYIELDKFLKIINANRCLTDSVKKFMTQNNSDIYFQININHILCAMQTKEGLTWFDIIEKNNIPMIRANFEHTLPIVNPMKLSKDIITEEYLKDSGMKIYVRVMKNEVEKITKNDTLVKHKTFKFWTSFYPSHYVNEEDEKEWVNIYFNSIKAINMGFFLYSIEGRVFCTREDIPKKANIFFTIPKELFNDNKSK